MHLTPRLCNEQQLLKRLWKKSRSLELSAKWQMPLTCVTDPRQLRFMTYHLTHPYWYGEKDLQANPATSLARTTYSALKMRTISYNFPTDPPTSAARS